jgi:DNA-binding response OmpR family regulator
MSSGRSALIVEEDPLLVIILEWFLGTLGWTVAAVAQDLEDALDKARTVSMDIAVLDANLHGRPSYPVAQILRERKVPFVFSSGYGAITVPVKFRDVRVLVKPFGQKDLALALLHANHWRPPAEREGRVLAL